jgi:CheY-like chemotaxis protein
MSSTAPEKMARQRGTVLVVEDDHDIRDTLCEALEARGLTALRAANGREAIELLRHLPAHIYRPSVILLDLMMPVVSGWDFLAQLRQNHFLRSIPVVVISAVDDEQRVPREVAGYLKKPFDLRALLDAVTPHCP